MPVKNMSILKLINRNAQVILKRKYESKESTQQ